MRLIRFPTTYDECVHWTWNDLSPWRRFWLWWTTLAERDLARAKGYAFLPCPLCGRPFSAEEIIGLESPAGFRYANDPYVRAVLVCSDCQNRSELTDAELHYPDRVLGLFPRRPVS